MTELLENANKFWQEFSNISLLRYFHFCAQLWFQNQFQPSSHYSHPMCSGTLSADASSSPPPLLHWSTTPPNWSKSSPSHAHCSFCTKFVHFERVLAQMRKLKTFPTWLGGLWAVLGAAEGCCISPALMWVKNRSEMGKSSLATDGTSSGAVVNLTHFAPPWGPIQWLKLIFWCFSGFAWKPEESFFIEYNL